MIILHWGIQQLGSIREPHCENICVSALRGAVVGMHDKVLGREETVQAKVPVSEAFWTEFPAASVGGVGLSWGLCRIAPASRLGLSRG
jgi:hypothetical protein